MRLGKAAAAAEAIRIADAFVAANTPADGKWRWECGPAVPDLRAVPTGRKVPTAWVVGLRWIPADGGVFDSGEAVLVDLATGESRFSD